MFDSHDARVARNRVFPLNTSPHIVETAKNPVSTMCGEAKNPVSLLLAGPETGFFQELFAAPHRSGQKPGFFKTLNELF